MAIYFQGLRECNQVKTLVQSSAGPGSSQTVTEPLDQSMKQQVGSFSVLMFSLF